MPPSKLPPLQECSAAIGLLRAWGVIYAGQPYSARALLPVVESYSGSDWHYRFGNTLFEHLAKAAQMPNQWTLPGPGDPKSVLAEFLYKTTVRSHAVRRQEIVAEFKEVAARIKRQYGEEIKFDHSASAEANVERARQVESRHWAHRFLAKPEAKGA